MRYSRLLIGLALIILALWVIVGEQMSGASANAVVNAPISTVRAPVTGKITLRDRPLGSAINRQEEMGSVVGTMVDDVRLNDLIMEQAFAAAEIEHARARLAALESQIEGLSERRDVFQRKRLEELTTLLSHARTRLQLLQDTAPDDGPETVLSGQGQPASEGTSRVAGIAVDLAQERIDELEIALNAATSGVFLGDGFNDAPYSEQYRTTLFTEQDRLTADMALAEARLAAIAARIGRERLRQNLLGAAAMESTVNGQLWDVLAADGENAGRTRPFAWSGRPPHCGRPAGGACRDRPRLDHPADGGCGRLVAFCLLRPLFPHGRAAANGISAYLAHGRCEAPVARGQAVVGRRGRADRLWFRQHLQHRLQPPCRNAAGTVHAGDGGRREVDWAISNHMKQHLALRALRLPSSCCHQHLQNQGVATTG